MAVKFPLKMASGTMVRTIEELREHFDLPTILAYYDNGRLRKWLENGCYDGEAKKIAGLDAASPDFAKELCGILGVIYSESEAGQVDLGYIAKRNERLERLKQYTADDAILAAVDRVAFSQEELDQLVSKYSSSTNTTSTVASPLTRCSSALTKSSSATSQPVIYLCGGHFTIPGDVTCITYIGIKNPTIEFVGESVAAGIDLQGIDFDIDGYVDDRGDGTKLFDFFSNNLTLGIKLVHMAAEQGVSKMQTLLGDCYKMGHGVEANTKEALRWYQAAAAQGGANAQFYLVRRYGKGEAPRMLGAIIGDIVGSRFEWNNIKSKKFELFTNKCRPTDDSIMTLAIAKAILSCDTMTPSRLAETAVIWMRELGRRYPLAGYGKSFLRWLWQAEPRPYRSYGNGSAMRVSSCAYVANTLEEAKTLARAVTEVTHNHPEGIKGAQATTAAIFMALHGSSIAEIRDYIDQNYYPMNFTLKEIRPKYRFDASCQGSVPQAIMAFLESTGFEDAIRNAISIGGDSDTIGAITGSIAEAYYGIPTDIKNQAIRYLDKYQMDILNRFEGKYGIIR